jgi:DNA-binding NtrC family response regulator
LTVRPEILLVEDDPYVVRGMKRLLGDEWDVVDVPDVPSARELLATPRFAGVIVDLWLSGGADGFEVVEIARRHDRLRPVIVVTGLPDNDLDDRAARLGAGFVAKPPTKASLASFEHDALAYAARALTVRARARHSAHFWRRS